MKRANEMVQGNQKSANQRTQFQLRHIFLLTAGFAVFFAIRSWGINADNGGVVALSPVLLAAFCAILAGVNGFRHGTIFLLAAAVGFSASTWWALECIFEFSSSGFLRRSDVQAQYSVDAGLHATFVVVVTVFSTVVGGICGTIARFRWSHPELVFYGSTFRYGDEPVDVMHRLPDNPYKPSTAPTARAPTKSSGTWLVRTIFYVHLATIVCGAFVIRSDTILADRWLDLLALPLLSTWFLCPTAMLIVVLFRKPRSPTFRIFAVAAELLLSIVQMFTWLPTFQ